MSDWDEDEKFSDDGSYEQFHQYDDYFSDNSLKNSGFDVLKAGKKQKKDNNSRRQFILEIKSEGFLDSKEFESFDIWRTYARQAALNLLPAIEEIKREIDIFNREFVLTKKNPIVFFGIIYLKCVKGEKEKLNKFHQIIFETTGRVHTESFRFLQSILRNISGYMDGKLLQDYSLNRVSCSYQQQLAISIRNKLRKQKGYRFILGNFENNPEFAITASGTVFLARH